MHPSHKTLTEWLYNFTESLGIQMWYDEYEVAPAPVDGKIRCLPVTIKRAQLTINFQEPADLTFLFCDR